MTRETEPHVLLDATGVDETLGRLADAIVSGGTVADLILVGIRRRGVELAERLAGLVAERTGHPVSTGSLDITLYRDDFAQIGSMPQIGTTEISVDVTGRRVVIVDDVLYTGRTIRAALNEIADFGRPSRIELCVLVDRGGRELPIQADYAGLAQTVGEGEHVEVRVPEQDGEMCVRVVGTDETGTE
ncbi:MAG: bifunctional pyr operon transcriptional regulator/uracil phosphoribosyltransferase PyrR [Gemmatimonadota bacterium]|nr:bifunctional pyr operon transcriptional regulator/uracil phosphoribosyltransferase PyrR [Gemmatimonadota bacterium]